MSNPCARWLITTIAMLAMLASSLPASEATPTAASTYAVYASTDDGTQIVGVDPATLADLPRTRQAVGGQYSNIAVSADGSTSVVIDGQQGALEDWITVHDGFLGPERRSIDVREAVYNPLLSADGSRLVAQPTMMCGPSGCGETTWYAYDTRTGKEVSTIPVDLNEYVWPVMLSPDGTRLYVPYYESPPPPSYPSTPTPPAVSGVGPWPLRIAVYDVDTGAELARREIPGVLAGSWPIDSELDAYAMENVSPAIALAPDGRTIAVIDAGMTTLTLLDATSLDVLDTRDIHERASLADRALAWLGILPQPAEAKAMDGSWLSATFSPDGTRLYLTGYELDAGDTVEEMTGRGYGVMCLDIDTGEITAHALDGAEVRQMVPSPDGRSLYVARSETPWWEQGGGSPSGRLVRLDADTLEPRAERELPGWSQVFVVPVPREAG